MNLVRLLLSALVAVTLAAPTLSHAQTHSGPPPGPPTTAVAALDRANAAYDYGDMTQVVDSARMVVDGALAATPAERLQALRLLGVALYLTGRPTGAEAAFLELLSNNRRARLDPTITRPEVVAFFEDVRRRHAAEIQDAARVRSRRSMVWNFLPPLGQFKNGDHTRGWVILGLEVASFATALTTRLVLDSWRQEADQFPGREDTARSVRTANQIAVAVLAGTWVAGVADAFLRADHAADTLEPALSLHLLPLGAALTGRF
jgi:hypothetical protein